MHRLSMVQALSLWTDLEDALRGTHGFGGNVAEIYVYRLMSRCPLVERHMNEPRTTWSDSMTEAVNEAVQQANESFYNVLVHFASERDAIVKVKNDVGGKWMFVPVGDWLKTCGESHRFHVEVTPREPRR